MLPLLLVALASSDPVLALKGFDPVELVRGVERAGSPAFSLERDGYTYRFPDEQRLAEFRAQPERFEIQFGGGCGRMGPLAGRGSPERWLVHAGRIFVFASDACRAAFQKQPDPFLDPDEPIPQADEDARTKGRALLERALAAHGGAARIDALTSLETFLTEEVGPPDKKRTDTLSHAIVFPDRVRQHQTWGAEWIATFVRTPEQAFATYNSGSEELHATGARELVRLLRREPLVILRSRHEKGFACSFAGSAEHAGTKVEELACSFGGTTTWLGLDPASGRVLSARYRGRGPRLAFGATLKLYSDFEESAGVLVPGRVRTEFEGADAVERDILLRVDPKLGPELFERKG